MWADTNLNWYDDRLAPPLYKGRLGGVKICRFNSKNWYEDRPLSCLAKSGGNLRDARAAKSPNSGELPPDLLPQDWGLACSTEPYWEWF